MCYEIQLTRVCVKPLYIHHFYHMRDSQQACVYTQFKSIEKPRGFFYSKYFFYIFVSFKYVIKSFYFKDIPYFKKQKLRNHW